MRALLRMTAVALLAIGAVGCARLQARGTRPGPPLEAPAPPPRVVPVIDEASVAEPPPVVVVDPPARPPTRPSAPPAAPATQRADRPEPAPPAAAPPPAEAAPARTLQTTANVEAVERKIRMTLTDASRGLGRIDYRGLSVEGKAQYDIAKRFVEQAEEALVAKNLLFASQLADKAAALAALLTR